MKRDRGQFTQLPMSRLGLIEMYRRGPVSSELTAMHFHSCFLSYCSDEEFAQRLHMDLQNRGVRCWFAPHDIQGGRKIHEQIDAAIRGYDKVVLVLSAHSMQSEWVKTEIANAR